MKRRISKVSCAIVAVVFALSVMTACSKKTENKQTETESEQTAQLDPIQSLTKSEKIVYDLLLLRIKNDFKVPQSVRIVDIEERVDDYYVRGETPLTDWDLLGANCYLTLSATNGFGGTVTQLCELSFEKSQNGSLKLCDEPEGVVTMVSIKKSDEKISHINAALNYYWESLGL